MATRLVKLRGIGYWAKLFESNRDLTGYDNALADIGGQTTIDVDLDERHIALLQQAAELLTRDRLMAESLKTRRRSSDQVLAFLALYEPVRRNRYEITVLN